MSEIALSIRGVPEPPLAGRLSSDERLARLVSRGSTRAFAVLYERHHQALYRYCRSILRDEQDALDALQSAMTRAFAALRARERDLAVRPWLFRIAHNEAVSILRGRRYGESLEEGHEPAGPGIEHVVQGRERLATLLADLQALPERQRAALVMRELSGLSVQEIAAALGTSPGAAKQVVFEARCALQEIAEGRAMDCDVVRRCISESDGRVLRARKLRAHMRACAGCREFREAIHARGADLRALAPPLPLAAAGALLTRLLASGGGGGGAGGVAIGHGVGGATGGGATAGAGIGGVPLGIGAKLGGQAVGSLALKALAGTAIVTVAATGAVRLGLTPRHPGPAAARSPLARGSEQRGAGHDIGIAASEGPALAAGSPAALRGVAAAPGADAQSVPTMDANRSGSPRATGAGANPNGNVRGVDGMTGSARPGARAQRGARRAPRAGSGGATRSAGHRADGAAGQAGREHRPAAARTPAQRTPAQRRPRSAGSGQAPAGSGQPASQAPAQQGGAQSQQPPRQQPAQGGGGSAAAEGPRQERSSHPGEAPAGTSSSASGNSKGSS